eukprot:6889390-Pyramimonas_sp.AAC.1
MPAGAREWRGAAEGGPGTVNPKAVGALRYDTENTAVVEGESDWAAWLPKSVAHSKRRRPGAQP